MSYDTPYPLYIVNRYNSFLSKGHNGIISRYLNDKVIQEYHAQDQFEIVKKFLPQMKYSWKLYSDYVAKPRDKTNTDPKLLKKVEFVKNFFHCSTRNANRLLEKADFNEEVGKYI